jgi:hypothetical protein
MNHGVRFTLSDNSYGPLDVGMNHAKLVACVQEMGFN